jgi:hypothetical protein
VGKFDCVLRDDFTGVTGNRAELPKMKLNAIPLEMRADAMTGPGA